MGHVASATGAAGPHAFDVGLRGAAQYQQGRYDDALAVFDSARKRLEADGDRRGVVLCAGEVGVIAMIRGDLDAAE